ncbi:MAG: response regulator [Nitrospira sp.]|nr:response regulator [Nitrospira sp.]
MPMPVSDTTSVLLIEPKATLAPQFRDLLAKLFSLNPDVEIAYSLQEAIKVLGNREISLLLVDVELPDGTCGDAVRLLRAAAPQSAVIAFAPSGNEAFLLEAVQAGSHALLHRVLPSTQELTLAVRSAFIRARAPMISTGVLHASSPTAISPATVSKLAHDLNNALMSINGFTDLLLARLPAEEAPRRCAEQIKDSCNRASLLTKTLARLSTDALP